MRVFKPQYDDAVRVERDRAVMTAVYLDAYRSARIRIAMECEIVTALLRSITAESGVACDIFESTTYTVLPDFDPLLEVIDILAKEINACQ